MQGAIQEKDWTECPVCKAEGCEQCGRGGWLYARK